MGLDSIPIEIHRIILRFMCQDTRNNLRLNHQKKQSGLVLPSAAFVCRLWFSIISCEWHRSLLVVSESDVSNLQHCLQIWSEKKRKEVRSLEIRYIARAQLGVIGDFFILMPNLQKFFLTVAFYVRRSFDWEVLPPLETVILDFMAADLTNFMGHMSTPLNSRFDLNVARFISRLSTLKCLQINQAPYFGFPNINDNKITAFPALRSLHLTSNSLAKKAFRNLLSRTCADTLEDLHIYVEASTIKDIQNEIYIDFILTFSQALVQFSIDHQDESFVTEIVSNVLPFLSRLRHLSFPGIAPDFNKLSGGESVQALHINDERGRHWNGPLALAIKSGKWKSLKVITSPAKPVQLSTEGEASNQIQYIQVVWHGKHDRRKYYTRVSKPL